MAKKRGRKPAADRHLHRNFYSLRMTKKQQDFLAKMAHQQSRTKKAVIIRALKREADLMGLTWPE